MEKFKKWGIKILKVIGIFALLYVAVALFAPNDYNVERSQEIKASPEAVFKQIADFEAWDAWSPWVEKDPTLVNTRTGEPGTVGHKTSWEGDPDLSGKGSMTITEIVENESIKYELKFEDMDMVSTGIIELAKTDSGTSVTWNNQGDIPFFFRPMMLFMNMDEMMGADFESGLSKLDSVAKEFQKELDKKYTITEIDFPTSYYYGVKKNIPFSEVDSTLYGSSYGQLGMFTGTNEIEMSGMPVSICFEWNMETEMAIIMPAFPVLDNKIAGVDGIEAYTQNACRALVCDYYGPYEGTGEAHGAMEAYLAEKGYSCTVVMEEFVTDPTTVESMDEVLTKIYYFLDE